MQLQPKLELVEVVMENFKTTGEAKKVLDILKIQFSSELLRALVDYEEL